MKNVFSLSALAFVYTVFALSSCAVQDEMPAKSAAPAAAAKVEKAPPAEKAVAEKAPAKAKVEKARGDVGLLDLEKNNMILVTKEGKLITLDFDQKTKVTQITPTPSKVSEIGLGSSATVTYTQQSEKNIASGLEYTPAKGGINPALGATRAIYCESGGINNEKQVNGCRRIGSSTGGFSRLSAPRPRKEAGESREGEGRKGLRRHRPAGHREKLYDRRYEGRQARNDRLQSKNEGYGTQTEQRQDGGHRPWIIGDRAVHKKRR
jgi:hypothetical protein